MLNQQFKITERPQVITNLFLTFHTPENVNYSEIFSGSLCVFVNLVINSAISHKPNDLFNYDMTARDARSLNVHAYLLLPIIRMFINYICLD